MKCPFLSLLLRSQRERKERKERENTPSFPTLLRALNKMDVASKACTLALAIGATHVNILSASISKIQNFIFSIQACLKVTFHVRTHVRGAIVVLLKKFITDSSALRRGNDQKSFNVGVAPLYGRGNKIKLKADCFLRLEI